MNELFVNLKVDREERPDLDRIYQTAHQMLTQRGGGWPLTMFLSPRDQRPFFGGTYFPPEPRHGLPGFADVLRRVAEYYRNHGADIERQGDALIQVFGELLPPVAADDAVLDRAPLAAARASLTAEFDGRFGGFGQAPKFPHPMNLEFLLRCWRSSTGNDEPDLQALYMSTLTLTRMSEGGIYDQLGGGFCRYSVDPYWMIPHFEKMLYDNGQLLAVAAQAALATAEPLFLRVTEESADWMRRDMEQPGGGFYSTLDADSEGHEGRFYAWDRAELSSLLPQDEYAAFEARFGIDRPANFEGKWHLHCFKSLAQVAEELGVEEDEATRLVDRARARLLPVRNRRVWPARDEKILTSWNGLAIAGLAAAARCLRRPELAESAARAADFLHAHCWYQGRLLAVHKDGRSRFPAYLDDHASLAWGLLELVQARWHAPHLAWVIELTEAMLTHFEDRADGGFFFTADDHEQLILRPKTFGDDATPNGNGVAARLLVRLGYLLAEPRYLAAAERTLRAAWGVLQKYPHGHTTLLMALDELTAPPASVVLRGPAEELREWQSQLDRLYDPRRLMLGVPVEATGLPAALAEKTARSQMTAYVCRGMVCGPPLGTLPGLLRELKGATRSQGAGSMKVGFIGLGNLGAPMARRLLRPEFELTVLDNHPEALRPFEGTAARRTTDCAELARWAEVIAVCVRDDVELLAVAYGAASLCDSIASGATVLVHSTVRPQTVLDLADALADRGARVLDAAVTGGAHLAATGDLCAMVGGATEDLVRARPVLEACCRRIIHAGPLGTGMTLKAANNLVTMLQLLAAHESDRLARAAGLDAALLRDVMTENGNLTDTMRQFLEFRDTGPAQLGAEGYGEFQERMGQLAAKDLAVGLDIAREAGIELPGAGAARPLMPGVFRGDSTTD